jgi:5-formyltetrahydrofolate cyclo-ligase
MAGCAEEKSQLRRQALARRNELGPQQRAAAALALAARPFPVAIAPRTVVSGFSPLRTEINPMPLMRALADQGAQLALPAVMGRGLPLQFRRYASGDQLGSGVWGIREPLPQAQELAPDIVLVPLLAFDRQGRRLGYGAGYYDRSLAQLRGHKPIVAIGLAYAVQEVAQVPVTDRDARLDLVLTEQEVIDCRGVI